MGESAMATSILFLLLRCLPIVLTVAGVSVDPDLEEEMRGYLTDLEVEMPVRAESEDGIFVFPSMQMAGGGMVRNILSFILCIETSKI